MINTDIFLLIKTAFGLKTKLDIENLVNDEILSIVTFLRTKGYVVDTNNGFQFPQLRPFSKEDTIMEKLYLFELFFIKEGIQGNWNIQSTDNDSIRYFKRLESTFTGIYDSALNV